MYGECSIQPERAKKFTVLQSDDACDLLHGLGKEVLLRPHRQHALLARRKIRRWFFQAASQHHVRARALEQGKHL